MSHETKSDHILVTPIWILAIRVAQFLIAIIILGLAGSLIHDAYLDEHAVAVAISLFTWFVVAYVVLTERLAVLNKAYHVVAVLALDALFIILWLATFAAAAARRARYTVDVRVNNCFDDGSLVGSKSCNRKRNVIFFESGLAMFSAYAGLGALEWLLFIATFVWTVLTFLKARKEGRFQNLFPSSSSSPSDAESHHMETKTSEPFIGQQPTHGAPVVGEHQQPIQPHNTGYSGQYAPSAPSYHGGPQYNQQNAYHGAVSPPTMSPAQGQTAYPPPPPQELYNNGQQPAQGQYPPQQAHYPQQPVQTHHTGSELAGSGVHDSNAYGNPYQQPPHQH